MVVIYHIVLFLTENSILNVWSDDMYKIIKIIVRLIINNLLSCTHFWVIKRLLLQCIGFKIGSGTRIVGPIYFGNMIKVQIGANCWIGEDIHLDGNGMV